jgi:hypothetical protein
MTPFRPAVAVATPSTKLRTVEVPKLVAAPDAFVTVGGVTGSVDGRAPEKVSDLGPL